MLCAAAPCWPGSCAGPAPCRTQDAALAAFLRKTFSDRSQALLSGSLKAPDGAELQRVLAKLDAEERTRESLSCVVGTSRVMLCCAGRGARVHQAASV
jgi:hypothetical protein